MATTLRGGSTVTRRKGSIAARFVGDGVAMTELSVELTSTDGQSLGDHVQRDGPHYRLTEWPGEAALGVAISGVFPSPSFVGCVLTIHAPDGDSELILQPVDVSALPAAELIRFADLGEQGWGISPVATAARVKPTGSIPVARKPLDGDGPPPPISDVREADPFGDAARNAARTRIGRSRVVEVERRNLHVLVDISASMLAHQRSGALQQVLNVLGGINDVHGLSLEMTVSAASPLVAPRSHQVTRAQAQHFAAHLFRLQGVTSSSGVASAYRQAHDTKGWTVVLSDTVPPDLLAELSPVAGDEVAPHLVAFAQSQFDYRSPALEAWQEQLAAARPAVDQGLLGVTSIDSAAGELTPADCEKLVASLAQGLPAGSGIAR